MINLLEDANNKLWECKCCIYCYTNKINGKKYIGQICRKKGTLKDRHSEHIRRDEELIDYKLNEYGCNNFTLEILKICNNLEETNYWECYYIDKLNTLVKNKNRYNISSGGSNGNPYAGKTEEEINEINKRKSESKKGKNHPNYGKHLSEEHRNNLSKSLMGKKSGDKHYLYNKLGKDNPKSIKICQYDKQGNLIKIWDGLLEVERKLGIHHSNISNCCKGKRKTTGGFIWKYYNKVE